VSKTDPFFLSDLKIAMGLYAVYAIAHVGKWTLSWNHRSWPPFDKSRATSFRTCPIAS
jgi:hypothetical protein